MDGDTLLDGPARRGLARLGAWGRRHRALLLPAAAAAFVAGMVASVHNLRLTPGDLALVPLALMAAAAPLSVLLNALELRLCARAVGRGLALGPAVTVTATATVANLLPVPASVAIRAGALVAAGAGVAATGRVILLAGVLWLAMAAAVSGLAFAPHHAAGLAVAAAAAAVAALLALDIRRRSDVATALGFVAVRAGLLAALVVRLWLSFMAIGAAAALADVAFYAVAGTAGTVVTVVPAGLGVSEGIAALMARTAGAAPAAAFLALGLNRVVGLLVCAGIAALPLWRSPGP